MVAVQMYPNPMAIYFFSDRIYATIFTIGTRSRIEIPIIPGRLVDCAFKGRLLSQREISEIALEIFKRRVQTSGLQTQEVSKAMLAGKFNPYFLDFNLAFEGIGFPTLDALDPDQVKRFWKGPEAEQFYKKFRATIATDYNNQLFYEVNRWRDDVRGGPRNSDRVLSYNC